MLTATKLNLESVVRRKLPPLPGSVLKISSLLQDYNVSQIKIAEAIGYDPMLASRVLRLANSPMYPFQQNVTRLSAAVSAIGNKAIYELVLMGVFADSFGREIRNSVIGREIWLHALAVAIAARELSASLGMRGTDEAFSCGLLHDIGSLLLFRADPEQYVALYESCDREDLSAVEKETFGFDHAQVGALAARRWNLSEPVCNMILYHHNPCDAPQATFITHIVHVADRLAYVKNAALPFGEDFFADPSVITLRLTEAPLEIVWEKVLANLREVIRAFFSVGG